MTERPPTGMRRAAIGLALAALVTAILIPAGSAPAKKKHRPIVYNAVATYLDNSGVLELSVRVHKADKVKITLNGETRDATKVDNVHDWWQANFGGGPVSDCYSVKVRAKNGHGTKKRRRHAGRLGTNGCNSGKSSRR
jgi:hypothetical protein